MLILLLQVFMPITYALNSFALAIATLASLIVWVSLEHGDVLLAAMKKPWGVIRASYKQEEKIVCRKSEDREEVPMWWYVLGLSLGLFFAIFSIEFWALDLRWYGVIFSFLISGVFYYPVSLIPLQ